MPFILRNVSLRGVDSVMCPVDRRKEAWNRLVKDLPADALGKIGHTVSLEELPEMAEKIIAGQVRGRVIVDVNR
jgi:acrylyl-CoA reductase (NADPH)